MQPQFWTRLPKGCFYDNLGDSEGSHGTATGETTVYEDSVTGELVIKVRKNNSVFPAFTVSGRGSNEAEGDGDVRVILKAFIDKSSPTPNFVLVNVSAPSVQVSQVGGTGGPGDWGYEVKRGSVDFFFNTSASPILEASIDWDPVAGADKGYPLLIDSRIVEKNGPFNITKHYIPSAAMNGQVTDGGSPVVGVEVKLFNGERSYEDTTDSAGNYEIKDILVDDYTLEASPTCDKEISTSLTVEGGWNSKDLVLVDKPRGTLYGFVTDAGTGSPIFDATVKDNCSGDSTTTDGSGHYSFLMVADEQIYATASANNYDSQSKSVTVPAGGSKRLDFQLQEATRGGSPFVAPWNGSAYVLDNNLLPESEDYTRDVQNVDDFYRLHQSLVPKDGLYSLQIVEFEDEHTRLDHVRLLTVDHENDFGIVVNHTGDIASFEHPETPEAAIDNYGRDVLNQLSVEDGTYYEAWRGDTVDLSFGRVFLPWGRLLVKVDPGHNSKFSVGAYVLVDDRWEYVSTVHSRIHFAWEYIDLSPLVPNDDLTIRLSTTKNHRIDIVGIDTSPPHFVQVQEASLVGAYHSELGDVLSLLSAEDGQYVDIAPGQQVTIEFSIPDSLDEARSFVLASSGFYTHKYQPYIGEDLTISGLAVDAAAVLSGTGPFFTWEVDVERLIWDMGDGTTLEGFVVNHVYSHAGEFTISVAVHYGDGYMSVRERSILVRP